MADAAFPMPPPAPHPVLAGLRAFADPDMERVEALIARCAEAEPALIPRLGGHIARAGGKRLRPVLTLVSARLCGGCGDGPAALAAGIEVFHMATLLHDDVVDGSGMRRGIASANAVWGNRASVLVGDYLIARAFRLILDSGPAPEVLELFAEATSAMAAGELRHMGDAARPGCDIEAYLEVVEGKTAALFATACRFGAIAAGARRDAAAALGSYGRNLGVAFQLADDVLDWSGRQAVLGKAVGDDFAEGKTTLPVILAFQRGDAEERAFWRRTFEEGDRRAGDFGRALELLERRGALADTLALARDHADDAGRSLGCFPAGPVRAAMSDFARFSAERCH